MFTKPKVKVQWWATKWCRKAVTTTGSRAHGASCKIKCQSGTESQAHSICSVFHLSCRASFASEVESMMILLQEKDEIDQPFGYLYGGRFSFPDFQSQGEYSLGNSPDLV